MSKARKQEPIGTRFGKWTIVAHGGLNKHNMSLVGVRCDCGRESEVIAANLRTGMSTGCAPCGRPANGTIAGRVPLGEDAVRELKRRLAGGETQAQLARDYMVTRATVSRIRRGLCWDYVEWPKGYDPRKGR